MVIEMADGEPRGGAGGGSSQFPTEQPIEIRRHLGALRRSWLSIFFFVAVVTAIAVGVSLVLPSKYRSTATIVQSDALTTFGSSDVESVKRKLQTIDVLLGTTAVLGKAAATLPNETSDSINHAVSSSVDPAANVIEVTAESKDPRRAARIANAVARALIETQAAAESQGIASARVRLQTELVRLRSSAAPAAEIQALRDRISELTIAEATIGSDLRLAEKAEPSDVPFSPRPVRNGVVAFFAALFLAVVFVIGRDLMRPRVTDTRELSQLMRLPVLSSVPIAGRRNRRRAAVVQAVAEEAFQTLQASVRYSLGTEDRRVVLITSAVEGEGKTTTAVGLAKALARIGQNTLLICADFRLPTLHEHFNIPRSPGLTDVLRMAHISADTSEVSEQLRTVTHIAGDARTGRLGVVPSGSRAEDPAALLFGGPLDSLLAVIDELDYDYVIFDGPPLLGVADGHALAQRADALLIAARLDKLAVDHALEARGILDRLGANAIGLVVGVRWHQSSYAYSYSYAQSGRRDAIQLSERTRRAEAAAPTVAPRRGASRRPR
jgi:capsular exopolysaccharide synthesis family protein